MAYDKEYSVSNKHCTDSVGKLFHLKELFVLRHKLLGNLLQFTVNVLSSVSSNHECCTETNSKYDHQLLYILTIRDSTGYNYFHRKIKC